MFEELVCTWWRIMMSCECTLAHCLLTGDKVTSMVCWMVLGALRNANCMSWNWFSPWWEVNAVLLKSVSSNSPCKQWRLVFKLRTIMYLWVNWYIGLSCVWVRLPFCRIQLFIVETKYRRFTLLWPKHNWRGQLRFTGFNYFRFQHFVNF